MSTQTSTPKADLLMEQEKIATHNAVVMADEYKDRYIQKITGGTVFNWTVALWATGEFKLMDEGYEPEVIKRNDRVSSNRAIDTLDIPVVKTDDPINLDDEIDGLSDEEREALFDRLSAKFPVAGDPGTTPEPIVKHDDNYDSMSVGELRDAANDLNIKVGTMNDPEKIKAKLRAGA